ncbi:MAG: tetratricopeptide repeat protein [Nitrospiraceae bacterium]
MLSVLMWGVVSHPVWGESIAHDYPQSLPRELRSLQEAGAETSSDPQQLVALARLYLRLGDDLWTDDAQRMAAYQTGARFARRALDRNDANAVAHFLYAANTGSAAQLQGLAASARAVPDLKGHIKRALELQPDHAPSLHMMGRMLEELPWIMGGNAALALDHLRRAVAADPSYAHARLDLAKLYLKRKDPQRARTELETLLSLPHPDDPYAWTRQYRPEAERLLMQLTSGENPNRIETR